MKNKEKAKELLTELINIPSEERAEEITSILDRIIPDPKYLNYVYYSSDFESKDGTIDVDAVIEKAYSYKPIIL